MKGRTTRLIHHDLEMKNRGTIGRAKRAVKLSVLRLVGRQFCPACGFCGRFLYRAAIWPELIDEWGLTPEWAHWFNLREGKHCPQCSSNLRSGHLAQTLLETLQSICDIEALSLAEAFDNPKSHELRIAEINSAGALHPFLAKSPQLKYSEYGGIVRGVPSEDLMQLSYKNSTFDLVITSETLEHVPDIDRALNEIHRILRPGGVHLFTVPVVFTHAATRQRARIENGLVVHQFPPSYHGGAGVKKSDFLVFYEFGADFVERCRARGFAMEVKRDEKNPALVSLVGRKV